MDGRRTRRRVMTDARRLVSPARGGLAWRSILGTAARTSLVAIVWALMFGGSPALGATGHAFLSSLSEAPGGTKLSEPGALAVDQSDGRVFVADPGSGMVDVFSSTGTYLTQFGEGKLNAVGVAVDEANGDVYVADAFQDAVSVFKLNGSSDYEPLSQWSGEAVPGEAFGEVAGVAVDNSTSASAGDVYVVDGESSALGKGVVDLFKPTPAGAEEAREGIFVGSLTSPKMEHANGVAVSRSSGTVFVADSANGEVFKFSPTGVLEGKPFDGSSSPQGSFRGKEEEEGNVSALALDESTGNLLVAESQRRVVSEFNPAGEWVGWITSAPSGALDEPRGVAVGPSRDVYVGDAGAHVVDVFRPGVVVPDVTSGAASKLSRTSAVLNGTINGDGKAARYRFEWGESEALGSSTPVTASGEGAEKVSASLSVLHAGTPYFFRISAENENGTNVGLIREFTTPPAVEGVLTGAARDITPTGATLTGSLTPGGIEAHYYFEWGPTTSYGTTSPVPAVDAGSGSEPVTAETALSGLSPNTTYHYRLVATNSFGTTFGEDEHLTTPGPPRITVESTTGIGHETATIKAKIDPDQLASIYHFEYGETTAYGNETPKGGASIGSGAEPVAVSAALTGLKLGVTYHFRVLASNQAGTTIGPDEMFTTVAPASIDSESVAEVSATAATLQTQINPLGNDTTYYFQYGTASCQMNPSACQSVPTPPGTDIGSGETEKAGSERIQGLTPGTTYFYRVVAINSLGTAFGTERTFTTQQASAPVALPDGRAWEMVTPPDKQGGPVEALTSEGGAILASENGEAFAYVVDGALGQEVEGNRQPEMQQVLAHREASGWGSQDIATPNSKAQGVSEGNTPEYAFFTPDLSEALVRTAGDRDERRTAIGARSHAGDDVSSQQRLGQLPAARHRSKCRPRYGIWPQHPFRQRNPGSQPRRPPPRASRCWEHPRHRAFTSGAVADFNSSASCPQERQQKGWWNSATRTLRPTRSRMTARGSFGRPSKQNQAWDISICAIRRAGRTVQLDAAQGVPEPAGTGTARFQTASSDGSRVFFTDRQRLTPDSTAEPLANKPDLYECEIVEENGKPACMLTDLTVDPSAGEHANVQGVLFGASEDGASTYFIAQGVLSANENGNGETALSGKDNLYKVASRSRRVDDDVHRCSVKRRQGRVGRHLGFRTPLF